jgi:tetraacyldisaccharide 4'-kinase
LPTGRLRELPDALRAATAVILDGADASALPVPTGLVFTARRVIGDARLADGDGVLLPGSGRVLALAGIARPERFVSDLRGRGWDVAETRVFRDHHPYSRVDVETIWRAAASAGAHAVLTTEKDLVRLLPYRPFPAPVAALPLTMEPEPLADFTTRLLGSLRAPARRDSAVD